MIIIRIIHIQWYNLFNRNLSNVNQNKQTKQTNVENLARIMSRHLNVMKRPLRTKMIMIPTSIVMIVVTKLVAICEFLIRRFFHHTVVCVVPTDDLWFLLADHYLFAPFLVQLFISVALYLMICKLSYWFAASHSLFTYKLFLVQTMNTVAISEYFIINRTLSF